MWDERKDRNVPCEYHHTKSAIVGKSPDDLRGEGTVARPADRFVWTCFPAVFAGTWLFG